MKSSDLIIQYLTQKVANKNNGRHLYCIGFDHLSSFSEAFFLCYGELIVEISVQERVVYHIYVDFETTKEDVSTMYGKAMVYMLQWEMCWYVLIIKIAVSKKTYELSQMKHMNNAAFRRALRQ